jgi:hypothetical protein
MVGAASSALGVFTYFMVNNFFVRSVNVRALLHCGLSLLSGGVLSLLSLFDRKDCPLSPASTTGVAYISSVKTNWKVW